MLKTTMKYAVFLVGGHLLLGLSLAITEATHGINDQDPSFLLMMVVYQLNRPTTWFLSLVGLPMSTALLVLIGILQWSVLAVLLSALHQYIQTRGMGEDERAGQSQGP